MIQKFKNILYQKKDNKSMMNLVQFINMFMTMLKKYMKIVSFLNI